MRNLILSSLVFILASCAPFYYDTLLKSNNNITAESIEKILSPAEFVTSKYIAKVSAMGKEFSGIFIVREVGHNIFRLALLSHTGVTIVSLEISSQKYEVLYALEQLNNKYFFDMLYEDIGSLIYLGTYHNSYALLNDAKTEKEILKIERSGNKYFCYLDTLRRLERIDKVVSNKVEEKIIFSRNTESSVNIIEIEHDDFPISITLEKFTDE